MSFQNKINEHVIISIVKEGQFIFKSFNNFNKISESQMNLYLVLFYKPRI